MANKSDELATKEMPFRCYVGYDSHEDITFEVSLRVFVSYSVFVFFASLGGGGGGGGGVARSVVIPQSVASLENDLSRSLCNRSVNNART